MSWISRSISARRRLAPSMRSSARAQASRALESASSETLAARSVSAIKVSAAASASAATRGPLRRASISLISALRFSANIAGAFSSSARSAVTSVMRASMVAICEAALCLRFCHSLRSARIACTRRSASSASRASACASARTCAANRRWPSISPRTAESLVSVSRLGGNSSSARGRRSHARPRPRRGRR